jgi:hypothetical protein
MNSLTYILMALLLSGCATIAAGTSQSVLIDTFNAPGATCKGVDKRGREYYWANTPSATTVQKGDGPMTVTCEKKGFKKTVHTFDESITGATFGNLILGGGIGFLVDATSGAAQEYPTQVKFPLEPDETASTEIKEAYENAKRETLKDNQPEK